MLRDSCLACSDTNTNTFVERIIEIKENVPSIAVGVIVKNTPGRPMLDTAYHSSYEGVSYLGTPFDDDDKAEEPFRTLCETSDSVVLEDESGRVELNGSIDVNGLATGVVVAVEGVVGSTGVLDVTNMYFPSQAPQDSEDDQLDDKVNVMLLSGLDCGGPEGETSLKRELLVDYLTGHFASDEGSNIARVVIAGGGCSKPIRPETSASAGKWGWGNGIKAKNEDSNATLSIRELDLFLGELVSGGIPVDYIPGLHDPTNANWPQKPMHPCLLPNSGCFVNMLSRSTNPYEAKIGGRCFLGSDGMNIMDLRRFIAKKCITECEDEVDDEGNMVESKVEIKEMSPLETLELALKFHHIAPTGPDSLPTFPFSDTDPFVMVKTPHVFFAGNCDEYETKLLEGCPGVKTRLICVPSFSKTGEAVILNLKTMDCTVVKFSGTVERGEEVTSQDGSPDEKKIEE